MSIKLYGTGAIFSFLIIYSPHSFSAERFTELEQVNPLHNLREPALDVFNECVLNGRISRVPSTLPSLPEATTNTNTSMNTSKEEVIKTDTTKEVAAKEIDEKREQLKKIMRWSKNTLLLKIEIQQQLQL